MNAVIFCLRSLNYSMPGQIPKSASLRSPTDKMLIEVNESMTQGKT